MSQDLMPAKVKRCYACIQWEGIRTYNAKDETIKTDPVKEAMCRVWHEKKSGRGTCDRFSVLL